jgi:hypothetical protein
MSRLTYEEIQADPTASTWLKNALKAAIRRDAVDAMCDAEYLAEWLKARLAAIQGRDTAPADERACGACETCPACGVSVAPGTCCETCGVYFGDPCPACGKGGYHSRTCRVLDSDDDAACI